MIIAISDIHDRVCDLGISVLVDYNRAYFESFRLEPKILSHLGPHSEDFIALSCPLLPYLNGIREFRTDFGSYLPLTADVANAIQAASK